MDARPRFIADENVGKLGRYLRRLGFDTELFSGGDDGELVRRALAENRVLLTRDTHIQQYAVAASGRVLVVTLHSDDPAEQLRTVIDKLKLSAWFKPLSLCLECNCPLEPLPAEEAAGRAPPYVLKTQRQFMQCPECRRLYWRGSHWQAMRRQLEALGD
jgi:uncharacterized protein with PIN domain